MPTFKRESTKNYEYADIHLLTRDIRISCLNCGLFMPFKYVSLAAGQELFIAKPCDCLVDELEEARNAEI